MHYQGWQKCKFFFLIWDIKYCQNTCWPYVILHHVFFYCPSASNCSRWTKPQVCCWGFFLFILLFKSTSISVFLRLQNLDEELVSQPTNLHLKSPATSERPPPQPQLEMYVITQQQNVDPVFGHLKASCSCVLFLCYASHRMTIR